MAGFWPARSFSSITPWAFAAILALFAGCTRVNGPGRIPYVPPVTFTGIVNDTLIELPGTWSYPNRCELMHDTVMMILFSKNYSAGSVHEGYYLRFFVFPYPDSQTNLGTKNVLLHFEDAQRQIAQATFEITPADSTDLFHTVTATSAAIDRRSGGAISIQGLQASVKALAAASQDLTIRNAAIQGAIE